MNIQVKRVYDPPSPDDGFRVLVDRLWPRGISREKGKIDYWAKDIAPSHGLRKEYAHNHNRWDEFRQRYFTELVQNENAVSAFKESILTQDRVTFLFSSKELKLNNAFALKEFFEK